jgi:hypothetical protein
MSNNYRQTDVRYFLGDIRLGEWFDEILNIK